MRDAVHRRYVEAMVPLSTLSLALMPLLSTRGMVLMIAFWIIVLLARSILDPTPVQQDAWRWTAFLALPFLLMLPDIFRAPSLSIGWSFAERSASLLLFPVGFLLMGAPTSDRFREAMMDLFTLAALVLAGWSNGHLLVHGFPADTHAGENFSYAYRTAFSASTGLHPPYGSYFFLGAALFQLDRLIDMARRPWWRVAAITILFFAALLLASRMPLIAFATASAVVLFVRLPRLVALRWALGVFFSIAILAVVVPGVRERVAEVVASMKGHTVYPPLNSFNIRVPIATCSLELISDHWLLGIGQANVQPALDACYQRFEQPSLLDGSYGTHNQLFHWWLSFGLIGLVLYVVYFGTLLITAWQRRDAIQLGFTVLILLCCITENVLSRQWGVVLFACFNALFLSGYSNERKSPVDVKHR
ncbi:MAG: O-antigen ligase family protein [Flavobacteriales bacterium]|nr:O-antigen ligase family protein [Flavobacteriales bacterium]